MKKFLVVIVLLLFLIGCGCGEEKGMSELEGISFIKTVIDKSVKNDKK